jgi:hypothetical protein
VLPLRRYATLDIPLSWLGTRNISNITVPQCRWSSLPSPNYVLNHRRYNAPEVENQDIYQLSAEGLIKCDVWAFALALWEILDGGGTFFKKSWRGHPSYAKSWPLSLISADERSLSDGTLAEESIAEPSDGGQHVFGTFDLKHLCTIGKDFINSLNFGSAFADKACLRLFIHRALQVDPLLRPLKIQLGPIMTKWKYVNFQLESLKNTNAKY